MGDGFIEPQEPKPVYEVLFEMTVMISNVFNGINPIKVRYEKASDLFRLAKRTIIYSSKINKNLNNNTNKKSDKYGKIDNKELIVRPASDDWF